MTACGGLGYGPLKAGTSTLSAILAADDDAVALDEPGYKRVTKNLAIKETGR
jgi:hypothetical protein